MMRTSLSAPVSLPRPRALGPRGLVALARLASASLAAFVVAACASSPAASSTAGESAPAAQAAGAAQSICTPPGEDVAKWREASFGTYSLRLPPGFTPDAAASRLEARFYRAGSRIIGVGRGRQFFDANAMWNLETTCGASIGGRPVQISVFRVTPTNTSARSGVSIGANFAAVAQWTAAAGGQDVAVWLFSPYKADLMRLRPLFWTVTFAGGNAPAEGVRVDSTGADSSASRPPPAALRRP
jgi:hypothetical protein